MPDFLGWCVVTLWTLVCCCTGSERRGYNPNIPTACNYYDDDYGINDFDPDSVPVGQEVEYPDGFRMHIHSDGRGY